VAKIVSTARSALRKRTGRTVKHFSNGITFRKINFSAKVAGQTMDFARDLKF
jgi:hypothetical protein